MKTTSLLRTSLFLILAGLLAGASSGSQAIIWTFDLYNDLGSTTPGVVGTTPWTTVPGIFTNGNMDAGLYRNFLGQSASNPMNYLPPSYLYAARCTTTQVVPGFANFVNTPADFEFRLSPDGGATYHNIRVTGVFNGEMDIYRSNAFWEITGIDDLDSTTDILNTSTFIPNRPFYPAWQISTVVAGHPVAILFEIQYIVPPPGQADYIRGYIADAPQRVTVSGAIFLSAVNSAQSLDFTFRSNAGYTFTRTVTLNANGSYSLSDIPSGNYTVSIKGAKWLRRNIAVDARSGNITDANAQLKTGDTNNDNFADIADLLPLIAAYNKTAPSSGYSEAADFNCDSSNDIADLLLLIGNYNTQGDL